VSRSLFVVAGSGAGILAALVIACAPGGAASAVRPTEPSAAEAVGESCRAVADYGEPLIVDWKPHQRANLEEAMADALAVVAYDCHSLRLLRDCHIDGTYGTLGISRKEEVIELENGDEIRANLPTFGSKLAIEFKGEMERGSSLNLAMVLVAKKRTTVASAEARQLRGTCDGATHYVRGAFIGAFAMGTASRGKVRAVAQVFASEGSSESVSIRKVRNNDGNRDACLQVEPGASSPPVGCSALVRVELAPIKIGPQVAEAQPDETHLPACPSGMVRSGGKCVAPSNRPYDCTGGLDECVAQCAKGSAKSCTAAGRMYAKGEGVTQNFTQAVSFLQRACDAGEPRGCSSLGTSYARGDGVAQDLARAAALYSRACDAGEAHGCAGLGIFYQNGTAVSRDPTRAIPLLTRACNAGNAPSCHHLGVVYMTGEAAQRDVKLALSMYRRSCDGGLANACVDLGHAYANGNGVAKDDAQALALYRQALPPLTRDCARGDPGACLQLGHMYEHGQGVAKDNSKALDLYRRACSPLAPRACEALNRLGERP
jgi:uncharacterized protein